MEELHNMGFSCLFIIGHSLKKILGNYFLCRWIQDAIWALKKWTEIRPKKKKNIKTTKLVALIETRRTLSQSQPHRIGCSNWHFVPLPTGAAGGSSAGSPPVVQCRISPGLVPLLRSAPGSPAPHGCSLPFPPAAFPSCLLTGASPFLFFLLPALCFLRSKVLSDQPCNTRLPWCISRSPLLAQKRQVDQKAS